jgi:hypothetical protein
MPSLFPSNKLPLNWGKSPIFRAHFRSRVFRQELLEVVAESAGVDAADILDVDLCLMDSTPPCRIGPAAPAAPAWADFFLDIAVATGKLPLGVMF